MINTLGSELACCVSNHLLNFVLLIYQCQFTDAVFCHIFAGAEFSRLHEFCVAAVRFLVCLCMLKHYFVLATCALCVSLRDYFFFCSLTNANLQILCFAREKFIKSEVLGGFLSIL